MKRLIPLSCTLLVIAATPALAEDNVPNTVKFCADWKTSITVNNEALERLQKNVAGDKPAAGLSYTKQQFVVLLGKNPDKAKDTLANSKDKLPKTSDGRVDLRDVTLNGFNLSGLNLDGVDFRGSEMNGVDLSDSSMVEASISKTEMNEANLNNANLSYAILSKAKLTNASLCHATLTSADLDGTLFGGAYLKGAKLDKAKNIPKVIYQNSQNVLIIGLSVPAE
jgi:uncharacterized protein YjbI with pentapeptide repeats